MASGISLRHKAGAFALVVLLAAGGVFAAGELGLGPSLGRHDSAPATPTAVPPPPGPGLILRQPPPAPAVLAAAGGGPPFSSPRLRRHLAAELELPGLAGSLGVAVAQLGTPGEDWHAGASTVTPASTMKLLTTTAALATLGPEHRFTTTVVRGRTPGALVLVGGGDPLLVDDIARSRQPDSPYPEPASLQQLAADTAARLLRQGVRRVSLDYDASLFTGPAVNPRWPMTYVADNVVSPITALWVDEGRTTPTLEERSADPARDAALAFRAQLTRAGITVTGATRSRSAPTTGRSEVAAVESAPLDEIVEHIIESSDNEGAEVLLRQVAVTTGGTGSSAAGVAALRRALAGLGLDLAGADFYDGSGLSRQDVLPVRLLLDVLETAASPDAPALRAVITGLPVAGFSGSLAYRFDQGEGASDGLGYVRAKTGTLTGVHGLAGLVLTRSGQVLVFAAVADEVPVSKALEAREDLDELAAALSTCGC